MTEAPDLRDSDQKIIDLTDERLAEFYLRNGMMDREDGPVDLKDVFDIARNAYWQGIHDKTVDPQRADELARTVRSIHEESTPAEKSGD